MNDREFLILKNILKALKECGDFPLLETHLQDEISLATPSLRKTEFAEALQAAEEKGLVISVRSERGLKYSVTDAGLAWLIKNKA